jgi:ABC-2 type transport system permease protein
MLNQAIAAEFFKASRRWSLLFWGFAFVPLCSFAIDFALQLNPIKIADFAPHVDLFSRMARTFEMSSSPLAEVFFIAAAAVIFGAEYDSETWRLLVPRASRTELITAKVLLYAASAFLSLILVILGACFSALVGAVRMRVPILWQATGVSPGNAIAMIVGLSWLELIVVGLMTGLIAVVSRSVLVAVVILILAAFCQALMISMVNGHASIAMLAALPGLCAETGRLYVTHTEVSPGRYITADEAVVAMLSLLAWIFLSLSLTLFWFRRQEFRRE